MPFASRRISAPSRRRFRSAEHRRRRLLLESLEDRRMLATLYVDQPGDYAVTANNVGGPGADAGDEVTWTSPTMGSVPNLIFGTDAFGTIQDAVNGANPAGGDSVLAAPGAYVENVTIDRDLALLSSDGRAVTTIDGVAGPELGTIFVTNNTTAVQIGDTDQGFTVLGIDGPPGLEKGALYFQGNHSGALVRGNNFVARGDSAVTTEFNRLIDGFVFDGNEFSGQTFNGPNPAGEGFGQQFSLPNVPRQLIIINGNNVTDFTFTNNLISGTAGGVNTDGNEQGNSLATIDGDGVIVTGNTFAGVTTRFGSSLRVRGANTQVAGNNFSGAGQSPTTNFIFIGNNATSPDTLGDVLDNNTFDQAVVFEGGNTVFLAASIQGAVDAATPGDVLRFSGSFTEDVDVNQAITLGGDFELDGALTLSDPGAVLSPGFSPSIVQTGDLTFSSTSGAELNSINVGNWSRLDVGPGEDLRYLEAVQGEDILFWRGSGGALRRAPFTWDGTTLSVGGITSPTGVTVGDHPSILNLGGGVFEGYFHPGTGPSVSFQRHAASTDFGQTWTGETDITYPFPTPGLIPSSDSGTTGGGGIVETGGQRRIYAQNNFGDIVMWTTAAGSSGPLTNAGALIDGNTGNFQSQSPSGDAIMLPTGQTMYFYTDGEGSEGTLGAVGVLMVDATGLAFTSQLDNFIDVNDLGLLGAGLTSIDEMTVGAVEVIGNTVSGVLMIAGDSTVNGSNEDLFYAPFTVTLDSAAAGTLDIEINGETPGAEHDQVDVTGTVDLGSATLDVSLGFAPVGGESFVIINNDGVDAVTGEFDGLPEGFLFTSAGAPLQISYAGGDGNDVVLTAFAAPPDTVYVDDDFSGTATGVDPDGPGPATAFGFDAFDVIQDGVDAVAAAGSVIVRAGTYLENVTIGKQVNLLGAQSGVDARGRGGAFDDSLSSIIETAGSPGTGVLINFDSGSAGTVIDGFTFGDSSSAIVSTSGAIDNLQILNNHTEGPTGAAVFLNNSGVDVTIDQNVFDGSTKTGGGGLFHLDNDNFDGFHFTNNHLLNDANGTGLFVDGDHNVGASAGRSPLIQGNLIQGNVTGMNLGRFAFEFGDIVENTFDGNGFDGLQGGIQNSTIARNTFSNNGRSGVALTGFGGGGDPTRGAQNNLITENLFVGNGSEDVFFSSSQFPGTISTNTLFGNSLASAVGASYAGAEVINASGNWWGSADPADVAASLAGGGPIDYSPWLDSGVNLIPADVVPASQVTTFEQPGFALGESIDNHQINGDEAVPPIENIDLTPQAWFVPEARGPMPPDEEVVDVGGAHGKVWRISQAVATGALGNAPQSPHMNGVAGETGAFNDAGRGPVTTNRFLGSFDFRSATGASQPDLAFAVQAAAFDRRHAFVRIVDDGAGFDLVFFETDSTGAFVGTTLDTNLSYTDWHNLSIEITFNDGLNLDGSGNDVVNIHVDGGLVHTGTSWETVYAIAALPPTAVDSLQINGSSSGAGSVLPGQLGGGLYFDNVFVGEELTQGPGFEGDFSVLHVDDDSPQAGPDGRVQEAVDLASSSEIIVHAGAYNAPVDVNRPDLTDLTIRGATGDPADVVISAGAANDAVTIVAPAEVTLQDLAITSSQNGVVASGLSLLTFDNLVISGNFGLGADINNVSTFDLIGTRGAVSDDYDVASTQIVHTRGAAVQDPINYTGVSALIISGDDGDDTFHAALDSSTEFTFNGGSPTTPASPGDTLDLDITAAPGPFIFAPLSTGSFGAAGFEDVNWSSIESFVVNGDPLPSGGVVVEGDANGNRIIISSGNGGTTRVRIDSSTVDLGVISGVIRIFGGDGRDVITVSSSVDLPVEVYAGEGDDYVAGGGANDMLFGEAGNDRLLGGEGDNLLDGGEGNDRLYGRDGDDTLLGGPGNDQLIAGDGDNLADGGDGDDQITGGSGMDVFRGGAGDDTINARGGNDILLGGLDDDQILGGAGNDVLIGGLGVDRLRGDQDDDLLIGGTTANAPDTATDAALLALLNDWVSSRYTANFGLLFTDGELDDLTGGSGADFFHSDLEDRIRDFDAGDGDQLL